MALAGMISPSRIMQSPPRPLAALGPLERFDLVLSLLGPEAVQVGSGDSEAEQDGDLGPAEHPQHRR